MARPRKSEIEYRNYDLPANFPVLVLSGDVWRISNVRSNRLHFHNCLEIGICESDMGKMEFMEQICPFKEGDVTVVGTDIPHTTYSDKGMKSKWSYIMLDIEAMCGPFFPLDLLPENNSIPLLIHQFYGILSRDNYPEIYQLSKMIVAEWEKKDASFQYEIRSLVFSLIIKLLRIVDAEQYHIGEKKPNSIKENSLVVSPALDYIRSNYNQEFSMSQLAIACNMSDTHFRRTFTSIIGVGPLEYLNRYRILQAANLLRISEMPVLEISETVGFRSVSSFNRQFLSIMNTTPVKWRKQMSIIRNNSIFKYTGWMIPPKDN